MLPPTPCHVNIPYSIVLCISWFSVNVHWVNWKSKLRVRKSVCFPKQMGKINEAATLWRLMVSRLEHSDTTVVALVPNHCFPSSLPIALAVPSYSPCRLSLFTLIFLYLRVLSTPVTRKSLLQHWPPSCRHIYIITSSAWSPTPHTSHILYWIHYSLIILSCFSL